MRSLNLKVALNGSERLSNPLQRVRRGGNAAAEALRNTREQLRNLQRTERTANAFSNTQQGLQRTNQELTQARQRVRDLTAAQRRGEGGTKRFAAEMRKASLQVRDLSQRSREQRQRLNEQRQALQQAGVNTAQLSHSKRELSASIARANQRLTEQQNRLRRTGDAQRRNTELARRHGQQMMRLGMVGATGYGAMSVGRRGAHGAARLLAPGADFESTVSQVQALTRLQGNDPALAALREQARHLGATTLHTAGDAASGQAFLAMAGFTPKAIRDAMPGVLDMATAGGMDLGRTADIASNILGGFRLEADSMGRVSDVLTKTFTTSNTTMEMLGESMKHVGPIAAAANVRLEQTAAMAGLLGDVGIQGSEAGTTLRAMLLRLSAPTGGAAKALQGLGMSITDEHGNIRDMTDILEELSWAMESLGEGDQMRLLKEIFGERPAAGVTELLRQAGQGNLRRYTAEVTDSDGEAGRTAATMADNLRGDMDQLRSAWADVRIQLFDENEGMLRNLVSNITGRVRSLGEWVKANPRTVQFISKVALGLIAVTTVLGGLTVGLITILGPMLILRFLLARLGLSLLPLLGKALLGVGKTFLILGRALMLNPIGLLITAIAGGAYLIWRNWGQLREWFGGLWSDIRGSTSEFWDGMQEAWNGGFVSMAKWTLTGLGSISKHIIDWSPFGLFYTAFARVLRWFDIELPSRFTEFGANIISGLIDGLKSMIPNVGETISSFTDSTIGRFKDLLGIHSPSRVFAELGRDTLAGYQVGLQRSTAPTLKHMDGLAKRITAIGAGLMLGSAAALPAAADYTLDTRRPLAAGAPTVQVAGDTITLHIHAAPGMSERAIAQEVQKILDQRERQKAARARSLLHD